MFAFWTLALCCCYAAAFGAQKSYGDLQVTTLVSVYDGDTFKVDIAGIHPLIGDHISIRIAQIDTPELKSSNPAEKRLALAAKELTQHILSHAREIRLINIRRDKYFRILADVVADGVDVGQELLKAELARPYDGGTKLPW